ncbi:MAG: threonine--tRNA ligase [Candidatus Aenigmatarchaeota archaeon]|nr:MAG: threonine--tRNA ligase [Candidatus Aenigmarchaeota archaeon]
MKILLLHSDFIEWEPKKKAIKQAEEVKKKVSNVKDVLVVFSAVEKTDEGKEKVIIKKASVEIASVMKEVKAKNVVVYPYVHLSTNPSSPSTALHVLKGIEASLKKKKVKVHRAPFGYYKRFQISVKGHPLSELSREIAPEEGEVSKAVEKEKNLRSDWYVMDTKGGLHRLRIEDGKVKGFDFSKHPNLGRFALYEMAKSRKVESEPPHIPLMKRLELVDYEGGSDPGNFRFLPKGRLIKSLLEDFVTEKTIGYGAMEMETPIMYDSEHPALKDYLNRFPARQYTIETPNKRVFLRFSACFGQFLALHDANISYRNLPLRIYELTRYSFRVEQRGELAGLRRLRSFTMPDCHAFCKDIEQCKKELLVRLDLAKDILKGSGMPVKTDLEGALRMVRGFHDKNRGFLKSVVRKIGKPVLVEMWGGQFFYFVFKYDLNFVDCLGKAAALTTDQIDVENSKRYGITYMDRDNKQKHPIILHLSPSGAIERMMYALLEKAHMDSEKEKNPVLPLWLSPVQVRFIPVSEKFLKQTEKIAEGVSKESVRVDVDDRNESVQKKIRDSELDWVPFIVVVGKKELKDKKLATRFRETGKVKRISKSSLVGMIKKGTEGRPFKPLPLPRLLTKRPTFIG